jgi:hypothetical protein
MKAATLALVALTLLISCDKSHDDMAGPEYPIFRQAHILVSDGPCDSVSVFVSRATQLFHPYRLVCNADSPGLLYTLGGSEANIYRKDTLFFFNVSGDTMNIVLSLTGSPSLEPLPITLPPTELDGAGIHYIANW